MTANYKSRHGSLSWVKQPAYTSGLRNATIPVFQATGAGSTTTIVSTTIGGATNAAHVSDIIECISVASASSVSNVGCRAMVKEFNSSTNTLTLDQALPIATASGDRFRHYVTNDAPVIATSAVSGGATVIATGRTEATDDHWKGTAAQGGYYLEVVAGDNVSTAQHPLISGFTASSDTFGLATSFGVNIAIGDFMRCVRHPVVEGIVMLPPDRPDIPANTLVAGYGSEPAHTAPRGGGGACVLFGRGPGDGNDGLVAEIDEALSCVFSTTARRTGVVVDTGSTTTSITYSAGSPDVGDILMTEEGDVCLVTADSGSALTVRPPLRTAPTAGTSLYGLRVYSPATNLQAALTVYNWLGSGVLNTFYGVVPVPTFEFARGDHTKVNLQLLASDFYQTTGLERTWYPRLSTARAARTRDMRFVLYDGTTSLELPLLGATFDPGVEVKQLIDLTAPNETSGYDIVNVQGRGTAKVRVNATTKRLLRDWQGRRGFTMLLQAGASTGDSGVQGALAYDVRLDNAPVTDDGGELTFDLAFTCVRNETALGLSVAVPQFQVFWG